MTNSSEFSFQTSISDAQTFLLYTKYELMVSKVLGGGGGVGHPIRHTYNVK